MLNSLRQKLCNALLYTRQHLAMTTLCRARWTKLNPIDQNVCPGCNPLKFSFGPGKTSLTACLSVCLSFGNHTRFMGWPRWIGSLVSVPRLYHLPHFPNGKWKPTPNFPKGTHNGITILFFLPSFLLVSFRLVSNSAFLFPVVPTTSSTERFYLVAPNPQRAERRISRQIL